MNGTSSFHALSLIVLASLSVGCVSPSSSPVRLNEIMPSNTRSCADEVFEYNDWIELYNTSGDTVDLAGYSLTDDTASPRKSVIPEGVTIGGQSALLFWADKTPEQGKIHLAFKIGKKTGEVVLYDTESRQVDLYRWSDGYSDVSFARVPDGTGDWFRCAKPTCGEDNSSSCAN